MDISGFFYCKYFHQAIFARSQILGKEYNQINPLITKNRL